MTIYLKDDPLIELDTIGLKGSPTNVYKSFSPPQKGAEMCIRDRNTPPPRKNWR